MRPGPAQKKANMAAFSQKGQCRGTVLRISIFDILSILSRSVYLFSQNSLSANEKFYFVVLES